MITGLDHIALAVADVPREIAELAAVLGRAPVIDKRGETVTSAMLQLDNLAIRLHVPDASAEHGPATLRLVLATADLGKTTHRLARRGLSGTARPDTQILDITQAATHGVPVSVTAASAPLEPNAEADIAGLDHVVIRTPDPERAVALYGGRLGLDLRLDRANPAFGSRMLFFVCGGLVIEVTHDMKAGVGTGPDRIWGVAWRANDIGRAHTRMATGGVDVSEIRIGRRPGTQVLTVKSHTQGVPTLVIGGEGLHRA